ncbi:Flp pilus assembly protein CpaB [Halomonas litopenaei]|uniref:Flp pilus assembly protein CpaB n=1 Tax=Halomonas litopenaei TaxID=2109328 RepID=A0ABX5J1I1_9GAMM|nr:MULTISPECIES: Flp pilus assembly protein CpaB [Halomonas]PTL93160.1 Flp pilus assembly protein CpaB [Halomonas sp. SYSU XM8]PTL95936.1 Flp pilus assembly protein CpaB [Halomonas litopenaei]
MSPMVLRWAAVGLVVLACVMAFIGWSLSRTAMTTSVDSVSGPEPTPEPLGHPVLVAARDLAAGERPADLEDALRLAYFPEPPASTFSALDQLPDTRLARPLAEGDVLRESGFVGGSALAEVVPPGFRAVGVGIDAVIGGGGFVAPGDRVDVLYFAEAQGEGGERHRLARRLFADVSVLGVGERLVGVDGDDEKGGERTAVLAMPETETARLLLAETTGRLRLAVVGSEEAAGFGEGIDDLRMMAGGASFLPVSLGQSLSEPGQTVSFEELTGVERPAAKRAPAPPQTGYRVVQHVGASRSVVTLP